MTIKLTQNMEEVYRDYGHGDPVIAVVRDGVCVHSFVSPTTGATYVRSSGLDPWEGSSVEGLKIAGFRHHITSKYYTDPQGNRYSRGIDEFISDDPEIPDIAIEDTDFGVMPIDINIQIDPDRFFDGNDLESVDMVASFDAYFDAVEEAVKAAYPDARVNVTAYPGQTSYVRTSDMDPDFDQEVKDVMNDVWGEGAFWVFEK